MASFESSGLNVFERLSEIPGSVHESSLVTVNDEIGVDKDAGFLRGHGTHLNLDGNLAATICGVVERVDKLVTVRSLRGRYVGETGDVVVGRITEVANKRWKVDVSAWQDAQLMLSAVNLPGGAQRKRTAIDELNMRSLFVEGDVISAEVQSAHKDGSISLHTRSFKYGKLEGGQLVKVPPSLIRRQKHHFQKLPNGVQLVIGCNGSIWVGTEPLKEDPEIASFGQSDSTVSSENLSRNGNKEREKGPPVPLEMRTLICRVAMCIKALAVLGFAIYPASILNIYNSSTELKIPIQRITAKEFLEQVVELEAKRREQEASMK